MDVGAPGGPPAPWDFDVLGVPEAFGVSLARPEPLDVGGTADFARGLDLAVMLALPRSGALAEPAAEYSVIKYK
ncbi:hypothetical protein AN216_10875 [Streptomyces oceani]|uniref:Uncharacterized protein n=1 Tax=Streptomyces oceani TaxID=1075402 RepID=A0A1E7KI16_9ACTN|nr:hypothetical protein AN216_10875 [Streptomyces oceani]